MSQLRPYQVGNQGIVGLCPPPPLRKRVPYEIFIIALAHEVPQFSLPLGHVLQVTSERSQDYILRADHPLEFNFKLVFL